MGSAADVVQRWLDWWHTGDVTIADELYADGYQRHATDSATGLDSLKGLVATYRSAFPDLRFDVEDMLSHDDRVAVRWMATATHRGELSGLPATERPVRLAGCDILRARQGKIVESWSFYDRTALLAQLRD